MKLRDYIDSLTPEEQEAYAKRCSTTFNYLMAHIRYARKEARRPLREALARQSNGNVSDQEVLDHFFGSPEDAAA